MSANKTPRIKILENGPYVVSGNVPLYELIIQPKESGCTYKKGRVFQTKEKYLLCRCGKSKNMPFCDGEHVKDSFDGKETASRNPYLMQAEKYEGPNLVLTDYEELCAFARFCHSNQGNTWELTHKSDDLALRDLAIKTAMECPAGRLVAWDKETGQPFEPNLEPSIAIIQDPHQDCSGPIWVRGNIQIEGSDGFEYETRNRVTLCRCGKSRYKPFCDATHVAFKFKNGL